MPDFFLLEGLFKNKVGKRNRLFLYLEKWSNLRSTFLQVWVLKPPTSQFFRDHTGTKNCGRLLVDSDFFGWVVITWKSSQFVSSSQRRLVLVPKIWGLCPPSKRPFMIFMAYQWQVGYYLLTSPGKIPSKWLGGKVSFRWTTELVRANQPEATTWTMRIVGLLLTWFAVWPQPTRGGGETRATEVGEEKSTPPMANKHDPGEKKAWKNWLFIA